MARRPVAEGGAGPPAAAGALLALPPAGFGAAREALARELAEHGDPSAAAVRKLRRPVGLAWVLNHLARQEHGTVEALLAAGERLRAAQAAALAGRGADEFRAAEDELRKTARALRLSAAPALAAAGKGGTPAALARVEVMLRQLAAAPAELRERFQAGLLEREPEVGNPELGGIAPGTAPPVPKQVSHAKPPPAGPTPAEQRAAARRVETEQRKAEAAVRARARAEARAKAEAARELARAENRARKAREDLARAEAAAADARRRVVEADAEVKELAGGGPGRP